MRKVVDIKPDSGIEPQRERAKRRKREDEQKEPSREEIKGQDRRKKAGS